MLVSVLGRLIPLAASSAASYEHACTLIGMAKTSIEAFEEQMREAYAKAGTDMQNQSLH